MSSWERGYGDFVFMPDLATLRRIPWLEGTVMVQCDLLWHDGSPVGGLAAADAAAPARRASPSAAGTPTPARSSSSSCSRETYESARAQGLARAAAGQRLQRRLLDPRHDDGRARAARRSASAWRAPACSSRTPRASATSASTRSTSATRTRCGWPTTTSSTATAPRRSRSCTAQALTFMPKYDEREGNSCHIHLSLWDGDESLFPAGRGHEHERDVPRSSSRACSGTRAS